METILVIYAAAVAGLALFGLHRLGLLLTYLRVRRRPQRADRVPDACPSHVTVQLPLYNERFVARRLLMASARLEHPRELLQIQILDDSTDDTTERLIPLVRRLRRLGFDVEHLRRTNREGFKAGALANGLRTARGRFVAIFDADFVPPPDFLRRSLVPFTDPQVGMVQSRWGHLNREVSLLTRLQAIFLDGHFLIEHVARHRTGRFFNFNGTAGLWRRTAIESAGGWQHDTLTEDLDLSYRAQLAGWRFVYVDDLVSPAELPEDMNAFKAQQHRWAKGSVQTACKLLGRIVTAPLPLRVKLESVLHLTNNLTYLIMVVPVLLWVPTLSARFDPQQRWMLALGGAMTLTTLCLVAYHLVCQRAAGRSTRRTLAELPALLALGAGLSVNNARAVLEALAGHHSPFLRTPKSGARDGHAGRIGTGLGYVLGARWHTCLELALAVYFAGGLVLAVHSERWIAIPFLLLFMVGFGYVGLSSLGRPADRLLRLGSAMAALALLAVALWAGQELLGFPL